MLLLSLVFFLVPAITFWRSNLLYAMLFAFLALFAARLVFERAIGAEGFKRRILILGAGARAARIEALAKAEGAGFTVAGLVAMNDGPVSVSRAVNRSRIDSLTDHVVRLGVSEVVLALEERRNALPLADLLRVKTTGVHVNDISSFLERETGRVDLDSLNPSWLIFSDGFSAGRRISAAGKRLFDLDTLKPSKSHGLEISRRPIVGHAFHAALNRQDQTRQKQHWLLEQAKAFADGTALLLRRRKRNRKKPSHRHHDKRANARHNRRQRCEFR